MFLANNKKLTNKLLLILGCQRSGTTLLASMLGRHSEVNMLFESTTDDVLKLIGKKYNGNKLLPWRQIRKTQKSSKLGYLINRIVNFDFGLTNQEHHNIRVFPTSDLSISDYKNKKALFITITRDKSEVLKSITKRTNANINRAAFEYDKALEEIAFVKKEALNIDFYDLIHETEITLKKICEFLNLEFEEKMLEGPQYNFVYPHKNIIKDKSKSSVVKINK